MASGDLSLYVAVFTIDGVKHTARGYVHSKAELKKALTNVIAARNATVEGEKSEIRDEDMHFGVTDEQAAAIEDQVRAENKDGSVATDLSPGAPNLLLHKSVADLKNGSSSGDIENVAGDLK